MGQMYKCLEGKAIGSYGLSDTIQPALESCNDPPLWEKILQNREGILLCHLCCTIKLVVFISRCNEKRRRIMCRVRDFN